MDIQKNLQMNTTLNTSRINHAEDEGKLQEDLDALAELLPELKISQENPANEEQETKHGDTKAAAIPKIDSMHVSVPLEENDTKDLKKTGNQLSPYWKNKTTEHSESSLASSMHEDTHAVKDGMQNCHKL